MMNQPVISVLVPTYNRAEVLERCLRQLVHQTERFEHFEVIVIDDGSTDDTALRIAGLRQQLPYRLDYVRLDHRGPAAARNLGIMSARAEHILLIQDDIFPHSDLVSRHLSAHREFPDQHVVVLGRTSWPPDLRVSPLMRFIDEGEYLFAYNKIDDPMHVPFWHFYSNNISFKRRFVIASGGFDEKFPYAAFEDTDLGLRLQRNGMRLIYDEHALGYHWHPQNLASLVRRERLTARAMLIFHNKHPDVMTMAGYVPRGRRHILRWRVKRILWPFGYIIVNVMDKAGLRLPGVDRLFQFVVSNVRPFEIQRMQMDLGMGRSEVAEGSERRC